MSTQTITLAHASKTPYRADPCGDSFSLLPRAIIPADYALEIYRLPRPSEWQTVIDIFRQQTQLTFYSTSKAPGSNNKFRESCYDEDVDVLFLGGWDRPQPYDGHTTFLQYVLMFRYTPVCRMDDANRLGFYDRSFKPMEALFLSSTLPKLRAETIMFGYDWEIQRVTMGNTAETKWIPNTYATSTISPTHIRDFESKAKCFAIVVSTNPGKVDWDLIADTKDAHNTVLRRGQGLGLTKSLLLRIQEECRRHMCAYAILSDGDAFAVFQYTPSQHKHALLEVFSAKTRSCIQALSSMIFDEAYRAGLCRDDLPNLNPSLAYQGALARRLTFPTVTHRSVSSFDIFTMHQNRTYFEEFLKWKAKVRMQAEAQPVKVGDTLSVDVGSLFRRIARWRSPFPTGSIPERTREAVMRAPRARFAQLDAFLSENATKKVPFTVTALVHVGVDKFSQVFFGNFEALPQYEIALKLIDERLIPLPEKTAFDEITSGKEQRLLGVETAEDMLRREEGVYEDKLKYLQGTMIPHCYGFHTFTLPDEWHAHGMLLEIIRGPAFHDVDINESNKAYLPSHIDLALRARQITRAFRYAGIDQPDWHSGQILCPPTRGEQNPKEKFEHELVCIDFSFAEQRLGDSIGCPSLRGDHLSLLDVTVNETNLNYYWGDGLRTFNDRWEELDFPEEY